MGLCQSIARALDGVMTQRPCVDVVIPVFNGRDTILVALHSVLTGQGDHVNRIYVVDDGSQDDTAELVRSLDSPLIELVRTPNHGVAQARNIGIQKASAEWIAFLDADDAWMPGKLDEQLSNAREYGVGFVCGSVSEQSPLKSSRLSPQILAWGNCVATSSVLVKRNILQQIQPVFKPGMTFAEDYLAWLKCITLTPGNYLSNKLVDYILSEQPRYRWRQIIWSFVILNQEYFQFLKQSGAGWMQRIELAWILFWGSQRSLLSIIKRFIRAYLSSKFNQ